MTKPEILQKLKAIKILSFTLRMGVNTIDRQEYIDLTSKLDRQIEKLIEDVGNPNTNENGPNKKNG